MVESQRDTRNPWLRFHLLIRRSKERKAIKSNDDSKSSIKLNFMPPSKSSPDTWRTPTDRASSYYAIFEKKQTFLHAFSMIPSGSRVSVKESEHQLWRQFGNDAKNGLGIYKPKSTFDSTPTHQHDYHPRPSLRPVTPNHDVSFIAGRDGRRGGKNR